MGIRIVRSCMFDWADFGHIGERTRTRVSRSASFLRVTNDMAARARIIFSTIYLQPTKLLFSA